MTVVPSTSAGTLANEPLKLPIAVLPAATITTSFIYSPQLIQAQIMHRFEIYD